MYSKEELHQIFNELYKIKGDKITIAEICKYLHIGQPKLHQNILDVNAYEDCPDVFMHIKKPLKVFETITPEMAYWIGYLQADGCVAQKAPKNENQNITYRLMLECKTEDKEILEKFCDFIGIRKQRITVGHQGASVALSLSTASFTTTPQDYGIVPNKSHLETHIPKEFLQNEEILFSYYKGLIDGDGTIHTQYGSLGISLVSNSLSLVTELKQELEKYLPEPNSIWIMTKTIEQQKGKNATQNLYILKVGSGLHNRSNLKYIYDKFYGKGHIILTRKEELLKSLI